MSNKIVDCRFFLHENKTFLSLTIIINKKIRQTTELIYFNGLKKMFLPDFAGSNFVLFLLLQTINLEFADRAEELFVAFGCNPNCSAGCNFQTVGVATTDLRRLRNFGPKF